MDTGAAEQGLLAAVADLDATHRSKVLNAVADLLTGLVPTPFAVRRPGATTLPATQVWTVVNRLRDHAVKTTG